MKLTLAKRTGSTKGEIKKIRREGNIPAVLYGSGSSVEKVFVKGDEFNAILRNLKQGLLPTTLFDLELEGKKYQAVIKDIQYNAATYAVEHIDLFLLFQRQARLRQCADSDSRESLNVPGIKLGGTLRQVIRSLKVACLPHQIPSEFLHRCPRTQHCPIQAPFRYFDPEQCKTACANERSGCGRGEVIGYGGCISDRRSWESREGV